MYGGLSNEDFYSIFDSFKDIEVAQGPSAVNLRIIQLKMRKQKGEHIENP